ncbi:MAG: hypothetical protein ABJD53_08500 [Gammaproteobacteria bacterium]
MKDALDDAVLDTLSREARSYNRWELFARLPRLPFADACQIV